LRTPLIDPRLGDVEDDASSTKRRSLLAIAGSLLAEISLPKLVLAWLLLIVLPGLLLGLTPLIVSGWLATLSRKLAALYSGFWPFLLFAIVVATGWIGGRPFLRAAEQAFWSLNSVAVQPGYALCRESLRHLMERRLLPRGDIAQSPRLRAATAAGAGFTLCGIALTVVVFAWPASRWAGTVQDLVSPHLLFLPVLANTAVILGGYLAVAARVWGIADATMDQPRDLPAFDQPPAGVAVWRIAHLSDLHVVGERYGFRIESGRAGPRGNERLARVLARLDAIDNDQPLDFILITGDVTDAGRSAEWAEFLSALTEHPRLAKRTLILPGNHDVNVVDRANPARLDLPTNPGRRLRQLRALSAMEAVQGNKARLIDPATRRLGDTLSCAVDTYRSRIAAFADAGTLRLSAGLAQLWADVFPMVMPPATENGLGILLINSTAETHFSFTNALGLISNDQARALAAITEQFPRAHWILALHHHLVEYPKLGGAFSERIGTALINGSWFVRQLQPLGRRIVAMHGHRHIDWIGECGSLRIISAPSPVMETTGETPTSFLIHRLAADSDGRLCLLAPERIEILGSDGPVRARF
jgi:predicted MPP superfamily phosphohydrolase